jgi:hypothetical protein
MQYRAPLCALTVLLLTACGGGGGGDGGANTQGDPPPTTSISGKVTYQGAPLAGVTVVAYSTNGNDIAATAVTDSSGNYSFSGLDVSCTDNCVAVYNFFAYKTGYSLAPVLAGDASGNRANLRWSMQAAGWNVATGDAVVRAGYNGAFTNPDNGTGAPINFSVITFTSLAGDSQTNADFVAYTGTHPVVQLAATGQTTSYAANDDAALHEGIAWPASRFVDNGDGTVSDQLTGLVWLKNASCFTAADWSSAVADANQLASGQCGLTDGSAAGGWRLPNLVELESLIDVSATAPAVSGPFSNVPSSASTSVYWTSTPYWSGAGAATTSAWAIRLSDGRYINGNDANGSNVMASAMNGVWAVKGASGAAVTLASTGAIEPFAAHDDGTLAMGAQIPQARMIDNGDGTITDSVTGLIWLKQGNCIQDTWAGALTDISQLASGQCELTDGSTAGQWRMPNRREMQSLQDRGQNNHALYFDETFATAFPNAIPTQAAIFVNMPELQYYWTSTTNASNTTEAWTVFSCDFGVYDTAKSATGYSLAVRGPL